MKLNVKNFSGTINLPYRIEVESREEEGKIVVSVWLKSTADDETDFYKSWACVGLIRNEGEEYTETLRDALLKAEQKWGIDLLKLNINYKTA